MQVTTVSSTASPSDGPNPSPSDAEAFKAKLKSLSFGSVPGGNRKGKYAYRKPPNMSWEAGIAGETRADGSFWPHLHADGKPIRQKEWGENRQVYERNIRDVRNAPTE